MKSKLALISFIVIMITCVAMSISLAWGFMLTIIIMLLLLKSDKQDVATIMKTTFHTIKECNSVNILVLLMGMTISIWIASGIVPSIVYYGFNYISNVNFLLVCFLGTAAISITMGTAFGAFSTIGMALFAIGKGLMIPDPLLMGALLSGAFVADKFSPISSLTNLTMKVTHIEYREYAKTALKTLIPTIIISAIIFAIWGSKYVSNIDANLVRGYQEAIKLGFTVNPFLALYPILVVIMAVMGIGIIKNLTISLFFSIIITMTFQGISMVNIARYLCFGFDKIVPIGSMGSILQGGGIFPMFEVIIIIIGSITVSGILEGAGIIKPIIGMFTKNVKSSSALVVRAGLFSILMTIVTCDQTVGILLPARFMHKDFKKHGLTQAELARTIADTGIIVAPLFPWNVNAILIVAITGVATATYAPYAVLCYLSPLVTFIYMYIKNRRSKENEK